MFTTQPVDVTVCLTQGQNQAASFTCALDREGVMIFTTGWHLFDTDRYVAVNQRPRHMITHSLDTVEDIVTSTLTVTNVSMDDNGAIYQCQPSGANMFSMNVTLTVLGEIIIVYSVHNNYYLILRQ